MTDGRSVFDAADPARRLTPAEAEAIVTVRGLLDEAVARTSDSTPVGRQVAAVLMHGAAEAAMSVGLARFDDFPKTSNFDQLHGQLVKHLHDAGRLGDSEDLAGWADVNRLRRVRNDAQHHQIPPDHQALVSWSGPVRRFVAHVVAASYLVEITAVSAATAIEHAGLRRLFTEAEAARSAGDTRKVVALLATVFGEARRLWESQRRAATGEPWSRALSDDHALSKTISEATRYLEETLTAVPFALDLGEYFWWRRLLRDMQNNQIVITEADAARAVMFVFTWITRWESFDARYLDRARLPRNPAEDPPASRRPDGAAELDGDREPIVEVRAKRPGLYGPSEDVWVFRVPYRNGLPGAEGRRDAYYLDQDMASVDPPPPWKGFASRRGSYIEVSIDPMDFDPGAILDELESRFERAVARRAEDVVRVQAVRAERQRLEDALASVAPTVLAVRHNGEQPFDGVTLEFRDTEPSVLLHFTKRFADFLRAEVLDARSASDRFPKLPARARMRYDGIACPTGQLDDLVAVATASLTVIDDERRRILKRPRFFAASFPSWKDAHHAEEDRSGPPRARGSAGFGPLAGISHHHRCV